ncbi:transcription termination factor Rho [Candidatus Termititenax dinenymphae]|uniref:Transcription termination factor Rho n=1 Tax=Candidatus Termititenax dinenymphae TaxID=2218523 RepID=A0A388TM23_9BACT|nr:transcription termination factor Rho [Candidatus Termititenax dinenymphae]
MTNKSPKEQENTPVSETLKEQPVSAEPTPVKAVEKPAEKTENKNNNNNNNNEKLIASLDIPALQRMKISELYAIAKELKIEEMTTLERSDLIYKIMQLKTGDEGTVACEGILERLPDGYGFLRVNNYLPSSEDIYVSSAQIRKFSLLTGDRVAGLGRKPKEGEKYFSLARVDAINGFQPDVARKRTFFSNLVPIFPDVKMHLEFDQKNITTRLIDMIAPIGFGQRAMVVSPPKAGKTVMLKDIARSIETNHPDVTIKVLLIDERPEEVTDMRRFVKGEVVASTFDEPPEQHVKVSELLLESAKRLVEHGKDVVILLDSITRLARAHNLVVAPSGRTLSGGLDPASLHKPKRFFGAARNIEGGGSLTIIATALVDTGSRMDDVIYEEFKGTGNMELHLDRKLANRRIYPAIDIVSSGTRKEELLLEDDVLKKTIMLRKSIDSENATEELVNLLKKTKNNFDFLNSGIFG